jgi:hypothetical protein
MAKRTRAYNQGHPKKDLELLISIRTECEVVNTGCDERKGHGVLDASVFDTPKIS